MEGKLGRTSQARRTASRASVANNQKIHYAYDARDRLLTTNYGDGSPNVVRTYTFDGLLETITSDNSRWTTTYNKRRLSTNETLRLDGIDYAIGYAHSRNGHVSGMTYPDGSAIDYAPNALGEATRVGTYATQIVTHPNGALAGFTYGNGIAHTTEQNERGLPSRSADGSVLSDRYVYDANANVASITDENGGAFTRTMTYDDLDRLKTTRNDPRWGGTQTFGYDALDNLRSMTAPGFNWAWQYTAAQRLDRVDSGGSALIAYTYDTRGRVATRTVANQPPLTFATDLADRVTQIGPNVASYRYDGHGRRTAVTKGGVKTVQVYSQAGQLLYQSAPTSTSDGIFKNGFQQGDTNYAPQTGGNKRYVYLGRHLIAEDGTAVRTYIHTDGLGSPVLTTSTSGAATARNDYRPYGWGPAAQSTPGYTGHVADAETGLSYMQARYYDPFAGRFLAIDPVAASDLNFNRYWYANNNPYTNIDPDGRNPMAIAQACAASVPCAGAAAGAAAALASALSNPPAGQSGYLLTNAIYPGMPLAQASETSNAEGGNGGESAAASADDEGKSTPAGNKDAGRTDHGTERAEEAKTDSHRQVGDKNKVIDKGRKYIDNDTGNTVYVDGDRVVVTNSKGEQISQFRNTRANTNDRVSSGRWTPVSKDK
ncbi:RHS repeat-associated core domain-containing protein [Tahibacter soli]|uniref:Teneurin-like YD-shell domain-containing protein n=1 Tax=Tahibacter soli TaxID=2983605 RepID=A0A9X3YN64_9GAMM|nr:RHS repeat-associated core domain-containing protein [Tahibacter soli]MDC8014375.1 hypothetical protein [Tahibacter soli]